MNHFQNIGVKLAINRNEQILWVGKPYKKCFILESIFNPLLPFAILWVLFDINFISVFMKSGGMNTEIHSFIVVFFAIHLMPVWIYICGVLLTFLKYKNTEFAITDKAIYVSGGSLSFYSKVEKYDNIQSVQIKRGFFDQRLNVGDIVITLKTTHLKHSSSRHSRISYSSTYSVNDTIEIIDVHDYLNVLELIQERINLNNQTQQVENIENY